MLYQTLITWPYVQYNLSQYAITFISKYLDFKKGRVTSFVDIIKNSTKFTKTTFEDSKEFINSTIYALKGNLYLYFLIY